MHLCVKEYCRKELHLRMMFHANWLNRLEHRYEDEKSESNMIQPYHSQHVIVVIR
jgi:hypothetical protein